MSSSSPQPQLGSEPPSHTSGRETRSQLEARLRRSISNDPSSVSSTATTLPGSSSRTASLVKPSSKSSADTNERLRRAESELKRLHLEVEQAKAQASDMRRRAEQEQLIAERLKLEGSASGISSSEANHRLSQIKREVQAAGATSPGRSTKGIFKDTCSTDLLFLIDTTGSMGCYINTAKEQVKSIVKDIKEAFLNEAEIRVAVVGYKDHGDPGNPEFLDFTTSTDEVFLFLNNLSATGGDDEPEDVLGGVKQALNASWRQQTRCIIHIADAPPHGRELQNSPPCGYDRWATPGSEPHGLTHPALLKQLISLKVNYAFLRIKAATDNMAFTFFKAYSDTSSDCKLHTANRYYTQANIIAAATHVNVRGSSSSTSKAKAAPAFQEMELGTKFSALQHLVVKMVTSSASRTAVRLSAQETYDSLKTKRRGIELREIREDEDDNAELLETAPPQWNSSSWFDHVLRVEGFSPDVVHGTGTLDDMMAHDDAIMMSVTQLSIRKRSKPFAQGAMRVASYALTSLSTTPYVVKSYKKDRKKLAHLAEDMRIQALCKAFALEFNALVGEESSLDFIATTCLKVKTGPASKDAVMSLEPFIGTSYVKYNGNKNYVNDDIPNDGFNKRAQAFSHFTFERSQGRFLVCDLQGVGSLLTDPAIHTSDPERFKLSDTNLGKEGFKFFFQAHACNEFCVKLALKSNKSMVIPERYTFREHWPRKDITACCSNKLCGKIVHLATVKKSTKYPGFYWCGDCWPQLSSTTKLMCVAKGPTHEFEVSKFFYESQGTSAPRKCNAHREEDIEMSRAEDTVGAQMHDTPLQIFHHPKKEWGDELSKPSAGSRLSTSTVPSHLSNARPDELLHGSAEHYAGPQRHKTVSKRLSLGHLENRHPRARYPGRFKRPTPHPLCEELPMNDSGELTPQTGTETTTLGFREALGTPAPEPHLEKLPRSAPTPGTTMPPRTEVTRQSTPVSRPRTLPKGSTVSKSATTSRGMILERDIPESRNATVLKTVPVSSSKKTSQATSSDGDRWKRFKSSIKKTFTKRD